MGIFDFLKGSDINEGIKRFRATPGAVLLDVREAEEYAEGHIPGSQNLPLSEIHSAEQVIPDKSTPLFLYCLAGTRSTRAAVYLRRVGYKAVANIGGINGYRGELE